MKLLSAWLFWLGMAAVIGLGLVWAVNGSPWLLLISLAAFIAAFAKYGCLHQEE